MPYDSIFTVTTPYSGAPSVTLWQKTWDLHLTYGHPEMAGREMDVAAALQRPALVCIGSKEPHVIFASHAILDEKGKPLLVCVNPAGDPAACVVTAYHGGLKYLNPGPDIKVLWSKP